jgi:hypothetical protein
MFYIDSFRGDTYNIVESISQCIDFKKIQDNLSVFMEGMIVGGFICVLLFGSMRYKLLLGLTLFLYYFYNYFFYKIIL